MRIRRTLKAILFTCFLFFSSIASVQASEERCLASAVYREANTEPEAGQYAVAHVVMNRVHSSKYPNSVCGVVAQPHQFPWYHKKGLKYNDNALRIAREVLSKRGHHSLPSNVVYFNHKKSRGFAKGKKHYRTIGNHAFYS